MVGGRLHIHSRMLKSAVETFGALDGESCVVIRDFVPFPLDMWPDVTHMCCVFPFDDLGAWRMDIEVSLSM